MILSNKAISATVITAGVLSLNFGASAQTYNPPKLPLSESDIKILDAILPMSECMSAQWDARNAPDIILPVEHRVDELMAQGMEKLDAISASMAEQIQPHLNIDDSVYEEIVGENGLSESWSALMIAQTEKDYLFCSETIIIEPEILEQYETLSQENPFGVEEYLLKLSVPQM